MVRHRLTDPQWELVQDLFPPPARTGRPRRDRREILDGILWILRTGAPWRDLPEELGPWATAWDLFDTWNDDGTLERDPLPIAGRRHRRGPGRSRVVVHRRHRGPRRPMCRRGRQGRRPRGAPGPRPGAFPRRLLDQDPPAVRRPWPPAGLPPDARAGHEATGLVPLLEGAEERVVDGDGEPIAWPVALAGDKGFRADWIDEYLLALGITPVIPSKENEDRAARAVELDREAYRRRSIVECLIGWLKECRRIFSRFEKTAKNFGGMIKMAFIQRYLRLCSG